MRRASFALAPLLLALAPAWAAGQARTAPTPAQLEAVFPSAVRFSEKRGRPPVFEAYGEDREGGGERLVGYVFLTSDLPPEMTGYSGPIKALVGMDLGGTITGVRVLEYHESLQETRGDFLARPRFQEQFAGKEIGDPFRVRSDVDGISGATITVRALSLSVRNAARRIAASYMSRATVGPAEEKRYIGTIEAAELEPLSWGEMLEAGLAGQVTAGDVTVSLTYIRNEPIGELLMGPGAFRSAMAKVGERGYEHHLMLLGIDGPRALGPPPRVLFVQGADTIRPAPGDFIDAGGISLGKLEGAFRRPVLLLVDHALDVSAPFRIGLGQCCGNPPVTADYVLQEPIPAVVAASTAGGSKAVGRTTAGRTTAGASADAPSEAGPAGAPVGVGAEATADVSAEGARATSRDAPDEPTASGADDERADGFSPLVRVAGLFLLTGLAIAGVAAAASSARTRGEARRSAPGD
jgi:hypothetical protein